MYISTLDMDESDFMVNLEDASIDRDLKAIARWASRWINKKFMENMNVREIGSTKNLVLKIGNINLIGQYLMM
jgi:hypothetical protein